MDSVSVLTDTVLVGTGSGHLETLVYLLALADDEETGADGTKQGALAGGIPDQHHDVIDATESSVRLRVDKEQIGEVKEKYHAKDDTQHYSKNTIRKERLSVSFKRIFMGRQEEFQI